MKTITIEVPDDVKDIQGIVKYDINPKCQCSFFHIDPRIMSGVKIDEDGRSIYTMRFEKEG